MALASGLLGAKIFQYFKLPQVVGYIVMGLAIGNSGLGILNHELIDSLAPVNNLALGIIGFMIGGELKLSVFKKMGRSIFTILVAEVLGTFTLVTLLVWAVTGKLSTALIFGALATATAPAATVDVLWEYESKGPLTTTILAIVGLDDALALIVYGFACSYARILISSGSFSLASVLCSPAIEIFGSMLLGITMGLALELVSKKMKDDKEFLSLIFATIIICCGIANQLHLSQILACMFIGMTLANKSFPFSERTVRTLDRTISPIYIVFFVFIGAKLRVGLLPQMGLLGVVYILGRSAGKVLGSYSGARISNASASVRKYLGLSLFSQAGVAVGLSIAVANDFSQLGAAGKELGTLVINVITATTFVVQLIGPPCVKYSIIKAGEVKRA